MLACGVSKSQVLRALASAWDWLTKSPPHLFLSNQRSLSLVFARLGVKSEIPEGHVASALGHLGQKEEKAALAKLECLLLSAACAHPASGGFVAVGELRIWRAPHS